MSRAPQHTPTSWEVEKAMRQVRVALAELQASVNPDAADDAQLLKDTIEGETDAFEMIGSLVDASIEAFNLAKTAREHAKLLSERATRFEKRREYLRGLVLDMMQTMKQTHVERADFTVWVRQNAAELIIDTDKLPHTYCRVTYAPDKVAIRALLEAGDTIEGAQLGNASQGITVRV